MSTLKTGNGVMCITIMLVYLVIRPWMIYGSKHSGGSINKYLCVYDFT